MRRRNAGVRADVVLSACRGGRRCHGSGAQSRRRSSKRPSRVSRCGGSPDFPERFEGLADGAIMARLREQPRRWAEVPALVGAFLAAAGREVHQRRPDVIHAHWVCRARCPRPARWRRTTAIVAVCGHCARRRCVCASFEAGRIGKGRRDASCGRNCAGFHSNRPGARVGSVRSPTLFRWAWMCTESRPRQASAGRSRDECCSSGVLSRRRVSTYSLRALRDVPSSRHASATAPGGDLEQQAAGAGLAQRVVFPWSAMSPRGDG